MKNALIISLALLMAVFYPLTVVWALNIMFPVLAIPYSLETWTAVLVLSLFVRNITVKD